MTFILRATLVIGVLTYFAAQRQGATTFGGKLAVPEPKAVDLAAAWNTVPATARDRIAREATSEIARRVTLAEASHDTLSESDRRPAWRGKDAR